MVSKKYQQVRNARHPRTLFSIVLIVTMLAVVLVPFAVAHAESSVSTPSDTSATTSEPTDGGDTAAEPPATDPTAPRRLYASVVHSTQGGVFVSNDIDQGAASTWTRVTSAASCAAGRFHFRVLRAARVGTHRCRSSTTRTRCGLCLGR